MQKLEWRTIKANASELFELDNRLNDFEVYDENQALQRQLSEY